MTDHDPSRFDRDPEALAWARAKISATADRYEAFAERAAAEGNPEAAASWRKIARAVRRDLIGRGHQIGSFDERLPALEAASGPPPPAQPGTTIDMHRWYAIVKDGDKVLGVIGVQGSDGLGLYDSKEEWERVNG